MKSFSDPHGLMKKQNKYNVLIMLKNLVAVAGLEPATNGVNDISSLYALPLSYTAPL